MFFYYKLVVIWKIYSIFKLLSVKIYRQKKVTVHFDLWLSLQNLVTVRKISLNQSSRLHNTKHFLFRFAMVRLYLDQWIGVSSSFKHDLHLAMHNDPILIRLFLKLQCLWWIRRVSVVNSYCDPNMFWI